MIWGVEGDDLRLSIFNRSAISAVGAFQVMRSEQSRHLEFWMDRSRVEIPLGIKYSEYVLIC